MNSSRRDVLMGLAALSFAGVTAANRAVAQTTGSSPLDFYISPTGSDNNPGTASSPWAVTALNSKRSIYAGKRVGLMDGTYDISSLPSTGFGVRLKIASGSATNPTVIQAVNPRAAIITAKAGSTYNGSTPLIGNGANGIESTERFRYITLKDLTVTGAATTLVSFSSDAPNTCPGILVEGCHIYDLSNPSGGAANMGGVMLGTGVTGGVIRNCSIHDCYVRGVSPTTHSNAACIYHWANGTIVEYCDLYNAHSLIYEKNQAATPPPGGMTVRYNYLCGGPRGSAIAFAGFNNSTGTTPPYAPTNIHHNVIENVSIYGQANTGVDGFQADWNFYNNTVYGSTGCMGAFIESKPSLATVRYYNNIRVRLGAPGSGGRGDAQFGSQPNAWTIVDFNRWEPTDTFGRSSAISAYPTSLLSLRQWKTIVDSPRPDAHSITADPAFVGPLAARTGAAQYKLSPNSPCLGAGRVGGSAAGTAIDMGAWDGATQIGANFSGTSLAPPAAPSAIVVS